VTDASWVDARLRTWWHHPITPAHVTTATNSARAAGRVATTAQRVVRHTLSVQFSSVTLRVEASWRCMPVRGVDVASALTRCPAFVGTHCIALHARVRARWREKNCTAPQLDCAQPTVVPQLMHTQKSAATVAIYRSEVAVPGGRAACTHASNRACFSPQSL